ncbi:hypothetical protein [Streptomyces cupreus]|uniref:Uncharacterized protein n=1 Tax=Streptomyces cupreus TaxID=2759956 RepID=A0A7X1MD15_9ACTN|nr:hypothetical protein [Streptomyces cupreus]MBC2907014.1 hypothetical protein [Streptomyces cupreus]
MTLEGVGVIDFQLYLLKVMDPPASLLDSSLKKLNRTAAHMKDRHGVVSQLIRLGSGNARNLEIILKEAQVDSRGERGQWNVYQLPLWPDFKFSILLDQTGRFVEKMEFEQCNDSEGVNQIAPWRFLEADLAANFDQVRTIDGWGHYHTYNAQGFDREKYFLRFAWGLLQEIELIR